MTDIFATPWEHRCALSGRKFRVSRGQGWYQEAPHKAGEKLKMRVVHPDEVRKGWTPRDWLGRGPEFGCCGILKEV